MNTKSVIGTSNYKVSGAHEPGGAREFDFDSGSLDCSVRRGPEAGRTDQVGGFAEGVTVVCWGGGGADAEITGAGEARLLATSDDAWDLLRLLDRLLERLLPLRYNVDFEPGRASEALPIGGTRALYPTRGRPGGIGGDLEVCRVAGPPPFDTFRVLCPTRGYVETGGGVGGDRRPHSRPSSRSRPESLRTPLYPAEIGCDARRPLQALFSSYCGL